MKYYLPLCALFTLLFLIRGLLGLPAITLWAEDGTVFFSEAGFQNLFTPYAGYYTLVPRFFVSIIAFAPTKLTAALYILTSTLISCIPIYYFLSNRSNSYLSTNRTKLLASIALVLVPGSGEVWGSLTNAQWYSMITIPAILFSTFKWVDIVVVFFLGLTGPFSLLTALIVTPIAFFKKVNLPALAVTLATGIVQLFAILGGERPTPTALIPLDIANAFLADIRNATFISLFGSENATEMMFAYPHSLVASGCILLVLYALASKAHPFLLTCVFLGFGISLSAIIDNEVYRAVVNINLTDGSRYRFPLILSFCILCFSSVERKKLLILPCALMIFIGFRSDFLHNRPSSGVSWHKATPGETIPIDPPGWVAFMK